MTLNSPNYYITRHSYFSYLLCHLGRNLLVTAFFWAAWHARNLFIFETKQVDPLIELSSYQICLYLTLVVDLIIRASLQRCTWIEYESLSSIVITLIKVHWLYFGILTCSKVYYSFHTLKYHFIIFHIKILRIYCAKLHVCLQ